MGLSKDRSMRLLVLVLVAASILLPVIAYLVYPGEAVETGPTVTRRYEPVFVRAMRHAHYYRGVHVVAGVVDAVAPRGFVLETSKARHVLVVLPPCIRVNDHVVNAGVFAESLLGEKVAVKGHVFIVHGAVVVKPLAIRVGHETLHVKPCLRHHPLPHHPREPWWRTGRG